MGLQLQWPDPNDPTTPMPDAYLEITNFQISGRTLTYGMSLYRSKAAYDAGGLPLPGQIVINIGPTATPEVPGQVDASGKIIVPARPAQPGFDDVIGTVAITGDEPPGTPLFALVQEALYKFAMQIDPRLASAEYIPDAGIPPVTTTPPPAGTTTSPPSGGTTTPGPAPQARQRTRQPHP